MPSPTLYNSKILGIAWITLAVISLLFLLCCLICKIFKIASLHAATHKKNECSAGPLAMTSRLMNIGCKSVIGTRESQQDRVITSDTELWKYAAVCDGMGGMEQGELASEHCIQKITRDFQINIMPDDMAEYLVDIAHSLDADVSQIKNAQGDAIETGTTLVAAIVCEKKLFWLSVGDSRIYLVSGNSIVQLTKDQNYMLELEKMVENGMITRAQAEEHSDRNALISYIGINGLEHIDYGIDVQLQACDMVVLCSDGLYKLLADDEIRAVCNGCGFDAVEISAKLVAAAQEKHIASKDNISVAVIVA
ncbi:MAG: protein phosphatase 2C domain-containing protein [Christensenella sp.]